MYFVHYSIEGSSCQAGPFSTAYVAEQFALAVAQKQAVTDCEINQKRRK